MNKISGMKLYIFDVWIEEAGAGLDIKGRISRKIRISGAMTLYAFAEAIVEAFDFDFDHAFGFYDSFARRLSDSKRIYELFVDMDEEASSGAKGVKKTRISQAFTAPGEKMLFLFDYGDEWRFGVELKEIKDAGKGSPTSKVLEKIGAAPEQYPAYEE